MCKYVQEADSKDFLYNFLNVRFRSWRNGSYISGQIEIQISNWERGFFSNCDVGLGLLLGWRRSGENFNPVSNHTHIFTYTVSPSTSPRPTPSWLQKNATFNKITKDIIIKIIIVGKIIVKLKIISEMPPPVAPDGGFWAYMAVFGCFMGNVIGDGVMYRSPP